MDNEIKYYSKSILVNYKSTGSKQCVKYDFTNGTISFRIMLGFPMIRNVN